MSVFDNKIVLQKLKLSPATPLYQRVPIHTDEGELASDFMVLFPGLSKASDRHLSEVVDKLQKIMQIYSKYILYAEVILKMSLLWVSIKPRPGLQTEIATAIYTVLPEARLVAHNNQ